MGLTPKGKQENEIGILSGLEVNERDYVGDDEMNSITDDGLITARVVLTQGEYDALDPKVATTEYIIIAG